MFTEEMNHINLMIINLPESLRLLIFGVGLIVLTVVLRVILNRYDSGKSTGKK